MTNIYIGIRVILTLTSLVEILVEILVRTLIEILAGISMAITRVIEILIIVKAYTAVAAGVSRHNNVEL